MKLIVCGKGGSGKSTVSALLASAYVRRGRNVLVVDSDESNFGLHKQLGLPLPEDFTHFFGHKKGIFEDGAEEAFGVGWKLADLPDAFVSRQGPLRLMAMGKIAQAGEGCACPMGVLTKTFLEHLRLEKEDMVIVDTEAGVEHFGRGVDRFADAILMIADPSYESVRLAEKITEMGHAIERSVFVVLNKANEEQLEVMRQILPPDVNVIAALPMDSEILMAGLKGEPLTQEPAQLADILKVLEGIG